MHLPVPCRRLRIACAAMVLVVCTAPMWADDAQELKFFETKIRPVLVKHCYECHAEDAKKIQGGLLLDTRAGALQGGENGPAVVPGEPDESLLLDALRQESFEMPPDGKLPDAVIANFEQWIRDGAADPRDGKVISVNNEIDIAEGRKYWAFQPPRQQAASKVQDSSWPESDVDRFVLARLEADRLTPVADADRRTLIRRAYFALVGLPPPPAEIDAFLQDKAELPDVLAKVVDRLLDSPQFGERWGRHWLDVARFAESSGGGRSLMFKDAWRYRDYTIEAYNSDRPFDQFVREQIAGDLLPYDSPEQRPATRRHWFSRIGTDQLRTAGQRAAADGGDRRATRYDRAGVPRSDVGLRSLP